MDRAVAPETLWSVVLYLGVCLGIGIWCLRRTRTARDFFMAGRRLGVLVTAMAVFSSTVSGFAFVGGPGLVYRSGMTSVWMVISSVMAACLAFFLLGKRIRLLAGVLDAVSLPALVEARYGSRALRAWTALAILAGAVGYLAAQILALSRILQSLLRGSSAGTEVPLAVCVALSAGVLLFYCVAGGILASVYTDLLQGIVMVLASLLVFLAARSVFEGGFEAAHGALAADDAAALSPWGTRGLFAALSWYLLFTLGTCGQPHVVTKLMMSRDVGRARYVLPVWVCAGALAGLLWIAVGLVMRAAVLEGRHPVLATPDAAAPAFLQAFAHPLLAGIVFAALFAAIMSTADGFLNLAAAAVVHDLPRALTGRSVAREVLWARGATVVIGVAAALLALRSEQLVGLLGAAAWGTFAGALVPVVALGLSWKRGTALAATVAIVASLALNLGFAASGLALPHGFDPGAFSLIVSLLLYVLISLAAAPPRLRAEVEEVMDL